VFSDVFESTWRAVRQPSILALSAVATIGLRVAYRAFGAMALAGGWLANVLGEIALAVSGPPILADLPGLLIRTGTDAAGLVLVAAIYHALDQAPPAA
jgi:hypothetical protein